ncbi:MAG: ACT domain-containing protein [Dehalococcoidia bacterium]
MELLVREHLAAMPASYLTSFTTDDVLRHLEAMALPPDSGDVVVDVRSGAAAANVIVVAEDRPGLLAIMSGVFALHNVSVLDGRFYTRADGVVLDSFHVADALGGVIEDPRWNRVREDMNGAARGDLPLEQLLRDKARAYRHTTDPNTAVEIHVDTGASDSATVVEVHCADRVGLLRDIARALFELHLDIRVAKIDTQGRRVVDTFYVRDLDGEPVRERARLAAIDLADRLTRAARAVMRGRAVVSAGMPIHPALRPSCRPLALGVRPVRSPLPVHAIQHGPHTAGDNQRARPNDSPRGRRRDRPRSAAGAAETAEPAP